MMYEDNSGVIEVGMVIFSHMIIIGSGSQIAMCFGHSVELVADGNARLLHRAHDRVEL
jgi:hypothetical protein